MDGESTLEGVSSSESCHVCDGASQWKNGIRGAEAGPRIPRRASSCDDPVSPCPLPHAASTRGVRRAGVTQAGPGRRGTCRCAPQAGAPHIPFTPCCRRVKDAGAGLGQAGGGAAMGRELPERCRKRYNTGSVGATDAAQHTQAGTSKESHGMTVRPRRTRVMVATGSPQSAPV